MLERTRVALPQVGWTHQLLRPAIAGGAAPEEAAAPISRFTNQDVLPACEALLFKSLIVRTDASNRGLDECFGLFMQRLLAFDEPNEFTSKVIVVEQITQTMLKGGDCCFGLEQGPAVVGFGRADAIEGVESLLADIHKGGAAFTIERVPLPTLS